MSTINNLIQKVKDRTAFNGGKSTLRTLLSEMGLRYGRLDGRAVVLERKDIREWRARVIYRLMENKASDNPKQVVYLDETWIDPHATYKYGITLKKPKNNKEAAEFSLKTKMSRGKRLIICAAGKQKENIIIFYL